LTIRPAANQLAIRTSPDLFGGIIKGLHVCAIVVDETRLIGDLSCIAIYQALYQINTPVAYPGVTITHLDLSNILT
jgi:hypothetical protein